MIYNMKYIIVITFKDELFVDRYFGSLKGRRLVVHSKKQQARIFTFPQDSEEIGKILTELKTWKDVNTAVIIQL